MELRIIAGLDGKGMSQELEQSLQGFTRHVTTLTLHDAIAKSSQVQDVTLVTVLILTPVTCQDLQKCSDAQKKLLLADPTRLIVLYSGKGDMKKEVAGLFPRDVGDVAKVSQFDLTDSDSKWYLAEAEIKTRLGTRSKRGPPAMNKYVILPDTVTKETDACLIACFEDYSSATTVTVHAASLDIPTKQIRSGVWVFDPSGLSPGKHTLEVYVDKNSIGTTSLRVQSDIDVICSALQRVRQDCPLEYLARMMEADQDNFDDEMHDILHASGQSALIKAEGLLNQGESRTQGYTFPTFFHFCGKFGLSKTAKWILDNMTDSHKLLQETNNDNQTPSDVARANAHTELEATLTYDDDHDIQPLLSPRRGESLKSTDSGIFAFNSQPGSSEEVKKIDQPPDDKPEMLKFTRKEHPYEVIPDFNKSEKPYDKPWGDIPFLDHQQSLPTQYRREPPAIPHRRFSDTNQRHKTSSSNMNGLRSGTHSDEAVVTHI